jgi:S1-C subfamily serine protease
VITKFGDQDIETNADLQSAVRSTNPGSRVEVQWRRGDQEGRATVTVGTRPPGG